MVDVATGAASSAATLAPEWRDYFKRLIEHPLRFSRPRGYLRRDMASAMRRLVPRDARVLEADRKSVV